MFALVCTYEQHNTNSIPFMTRMLERANLEPTFSHNTGESEAKNQTSIWVSFRRSEKRICESWHITTRTVCSNRMLWFVDRLISHISESSFVVGWFCLSPCCNSWFGAVVQPKQTGSSIPMFPFDCCMNQNINQTKQEVTQTNWKLPVTACWWEMW